MKWKIILSFTLFTLALLVGIYLILSYLPLPHQYPKLSPTAAEEKQKWAIHVEHARMQSYLHQYEEAEREYRQLLETNPNAIDIKYELAQILYYQKEYSEALNLLQSIPETSRDDAIILLMADVYLSQGHYAEAEMLYRKYLKSFPENQKVMAKLAELLSWQKKYDEAIQFYQQVLDKDPKNIQIRRQYGKVLIWMGKYQEGAEELKKTLAKENQTRVNKKEE